MPSRFPIMFVGNVMGVMVERPENLMVFLPQSGALQLLGSRDENVQQAGLMQGQIFLNAQPINIWLNGEGPQPAPGTDPNASSMRNAAATARRNSKSLRRVRVVACRYP